ncbi:MAG TPA: phosphoribosyltransferase [Verrucomicrobiae bacterium]|nr:phosphoribosyltransferase [Verrucomicrobiae bacterium]
MSESECPLVIKFVGVGDGFEIGSAVSPEWNRRNQAYHALLNELNLPEICEVCVYTVQNEKPSDLARELHEYFATTFAEHPKSRLRIIDITACRLGINTLDALTPDLKAAAACSEGKVVVLVAADYLPMIEASPHVADMSKELSAEEQAMVFVDQMGNIYVVGAYRGTRLRDPLSLLNELAAPPTTEEFRRRTVRQSERWFGHFIMSAEAHVRTHYDCYHGVLRDDWLFRYVVSEAGKIVQKTKPTMLVGFGLAETSVMHLASLVGGQANLAYVMQTPASSDYLNSIPRGSDVLLVTDMVLTGRTATTLLDEIVNAGSTVVGILTLLSLSNSAAYIGDGVPVLSLCKIKRAFYQSESECPLCRCGYPSTEVRSLSDFRCLPEAANAYDFWEAVSETNAFSAQHREYEGKHYTYYVDVERVCTLYDEPIARQLIHQLKSVLEIDRPHIILYPESAAAARLAGAVAKKLHIARVNVLAIRREYLEKPTISDHFTLPNELAVIRDQRVLVVDDGCNTLKTISAVENMLHRAHATLLGYMVALNRANTELTMRKMAESKGKFQFYYHWPVVTYRNKRECPECASV